MPGNQRRYGATYRVFNLRTFCDHGNTLGYQSRVDGNAPEVWHPGLRRLRLAAGRGRRERVRLEGKLGGGPGGRRQLLRRVCLPPGLTGTTLAAGTYPAASLLTARLACQYDGKGDA